MIRPSDLTTKGYRFMRHLSRYHRACWLLLLLIVRSVQVAGQTAGQAPVKSCLWRVTSKELDSRKVPTSPLQFFYSKPRPSKPGWSFTNPSAYGLFSWVVVPRTLLRLHAPLESAFRMPGNLWRISKRVVLLCDELMRSSSDYGDFWIFSGASDNSAASD